jgi:hypothetical protein
MLVAYLTCVNISELIKIFLAGWLGFEEMNAPLEEMKRWIVKAPILYSGERGLESSQSIR